MKKTVGDIVGRPLDPRTFNDSPALVDNSTFIGVEIELEKAGSFTSKFFNDFPMEKLCESHKEELVENEKTT